MKLTRMTFTSATAALLMLGTSTQANAATLELDTMSGVSSMASCQALSSHPAGDACYHAYGDYFYLRDQSGPGKVAVHWKLGDDSRRGLIRWAANDQFVIGVMNKNLPEGKQVGIRFGVCMTSACDSLAEVNFEGSSWRWTSTG